MTPFHPDAEVVAQIDQLWIHPVKSCAGLSLQAARLTPTGLQWDRHWMVVDHEGGFVTQRELPRMVLIQPSFESDQLVLRAPGRAPLSLGLATVGEPLQVRVWEDTVVAFDMGEAAANWFSEFLGPEAPADLQRLRLVRFDPAGPRVSSLAWTGGRKAFCQFADGFGLLLTSTASLVELNARLDAAGEAAVNQQRLRPNIVLGGVAAHDEDRLGPIAIDAEGGSALIETVKPCARCPVPNIDPATATSKPAVSDALQAYRADPRLNGAITFGMNAIVIEGAGVLLTVGQKLSASWRFE